MKELHRGEYGPYMNGRMLAKKFQWLGYYWSTMEDDCYVYMRRCDKCQL